MLSSVVIELHTDAPAKPAAGEPCTGCGVCCALETCPLGRLRYLQRRGPCPALRWSADETRYHCGLLRAPAEHFPALPAALVPFAARLAARWISAGSGCDCDADVQP